jgi:protein-disulfide isomerase
MAKQQKVIRRQWRREQLEAQEKADKKRQIRCTALAALVVFLVVGVGVYQSLTVPKVDAPDEVMAANIDGPADAPVRIVEFGDFGCPTCRQWHLAGIRERLKAEFGDQISFTFRHFPVITSLSPKAAEAGQCAAEQDAFWTYHDYIYEQTILESLDVAELKAYAALVGLNTLQFNGCLDSGKYADYVARDRRAAQAAGAAGTPSFYINGEPVSFSYEAMAGTIRELLDS